MGDGTHPENDDNADNDGAGDHRPPCLDADGGAQEGPGARADRCAACVAQLSAAVHVAARTSPGGVPEAQLVYAWWQAWAAALTPGSGE